MAKSSTLRGRVNEADEEGSDLDASDAGGEELTLKLTGLPDDIDLDSVGVDLIGGGGDEDADLGGDDGGGEDPIEDQGGGDDEEIDLGDLDLGDDDQGGGDQMEATKLSDDTIVEIDEKMLAREIKRMKNIRELQARDMNEPVPSSEGNGGDNAETLDDFGGGSSEGDPVADATVRTEGEELDEDDAVDVSEMKRRIRVEQNIQKTSRARLSRLQNAVRTVPTARRGQIRTECARLTKAINESRARTAKLSLRLRKESVQAPSRSSNSTRRAQAPSAREQALSSKLAESNLYNVKLSYANKVLQSSLTKSQQATVIERLDEAKTPREAKLVYETVAKAFKASRQSVNESSERKLPLGSSSRVTRPASTDLNEGFETQRWAKLAGING